MKIYKKYLIKNLFKPLIISATTLTAIIWSSRVINFLDLVVQDGAEAFSFFKITLYVLPSLILMILPLTVFLTTILTYNKLIENREIIILKNCGVTKTKLLTPLLILSIIITVISYFISIHVSYKSNLAMRTTRQEIRENLSYSMIKEGSFTKFKNLVIYAEKKDDNNIKNIIIYKVAKKPEEKNILLQSEYAIVNKNIINLYNGNFQQFTSTTKNEPNILFFKEYSLDTNDLNENKSELVLKPDSLSLIQLIDILKNYKNTKQEYSKNKIIYEINYRLAFPLVSIIMAILSGSLMLHGSFSRTSSIKILLRTSAASILTYILLLSIFQKVEKNINFIYIQYVIMIIILFLSSKLLRERNV